MATDVFDQLAENQIPQPPEKFDQEVHIRLNRTLLAVQLFELCTQCLPWLLKHFGQAVAGTIRYTLTGSFDNKHRKS